MTIFFLNQLLLRKNVLPPIIVESTGNLTLDDNNTIRMASKTYKIVAPARFVTAAPTWRNYLWMSYKKPNPPSKSLLPTNRAEAYVWNKFIVNGWRQGLAQANEIFSANLNHLKRDFLGMIQYRKMLTEKMISTPKVSSANLGITGNKYEMRINDEINRITSKSELQLNSAKWLPILTNQQDESASDDSADE